jgi:putative ABC transport system permease protein
MVMKLKSFYKDVFREIWHTKGRFFSIFAIVAIGVGFFVGVKATCPDMKYTSWEYYNSSNLMDLRFISTIGFDPEDVEKLEAVSGISVMPSYTADVFLQTESDNRVVRTYSLPPDQTINRPTVKKGRLPEQTGECAIDHKLGGTYKVGDTITLASGTKDPLSDSLATDAYTIVGIVESPLYVAYERGNSSIGNGTVDGFLLIPESDYTSEYFTDLYLKIDGSSDLDPFLDEYPALVESKTKELKDNVLAILNDRRTRIVEEAQEKLADAKQELNDGEQESEQELADARQKIEDARKELEDGQTEYDKNLADFNKAIEDGRKKLGDARQELADGRTTYENSLTLYHSIYALYTNPPQPGADMRFSAETEALLSQSAAFDENLPLLLRGYLLSKDAQTTAMLEGALSQIKSGLDQTGAQLTSGEEALKSQTAQLNDQEADGRKQFEESYRELEDGRVKLADAEQKYADGEKEANDKITEAKEKIADAEREIADIPTVKLYTLNRDDNPGYSGFGEDADKVDAIAKIFPVFFILVAALVCLTTMTRMVEEQRTQIGTLKALGYGKSTIILKYLIYASIASIGGGLTGFLIGIKLFPLIIYNAYGMLYTLPPLIAPFRWDYAFWCILAAVLCTCLSAFAACYKELASVPATLMRPKAPKAGKRVLLERIGFIWSHIGFLKKVTIRNLFRYKNRAFMTIIGIAGCTALMLTGFGLKDSISAIVSKQFGEVMVYDAALALDEDASAENLTAVRKSVAEDENFSETLEMEQKAIDVSANGRQQDANLMVPKQLDRLDAFLHLKVRSSGEVLTLTDDQVIISEKLASLLKVTIGDTITLSPNTNDAAEVTVAALTENYAYHYIYMTPALYQNLYGSEPFYNTILFNMKEAAQEHDVISTKYLENESVLAVSFLDEHTKTFQDMISSLNYIVFVLIVSSGALAFVVLYNLSNINVNERMRELATIKVLGFYDKEVSAYIYRENTISSLIGMALGLVLGIFLHRFVVFTAEVDMVMFYRQISPISYVWAGLLTMAFTLIVNFVLHFKLKKINMAESLKSIE